MNIRKATACTIRYAQDTIVLSGASQPIHLEAQRILRRFAHSARPYEVRIDTPERIVLAAAA